MMSAKQKMLALLAAAAVFALAGCALFSEPKNTVLPDPTFTEFGAQEVVWQPCENNMECADVYAPLDWQNLTGDRITLRLVKQPALQGESLGTIFVNPGGPGASGTSFVQNSIHRAVTEPLQQDYDVVGWDPRGVAPSTPVTCLDHAGMDEFLFGDPELGGIELGSAEWIAESQAEAREFADACTEATGELLGYVGTQDTVQDLEMLRQLVDDDHLNYVGYSYGTYIGARYADAYPERVGRMVLDGAIDPTSDEADVVRYQTVGFENALRAYVSDCVSESKCQYGATVDEGMAQWGALLAAVDEEPLRADDGRFVGSGVLLTAIVTPLYNQSNWPLLDRLYTDTLAGKPATALSLADLYYDRENGTYVNNSTEAFVAANCLDYPRGEVLDVQQMHDNAAELIELAPTIGRYQGYGELFCSAWPAKGATSREPVVAAGAEPILVIGTTGDPATPYRWAESLADQLESGVLVTYVGEGHTAYGSNSCVNTIVESYFLTGEVPAAGARC